MEKNLICPTGALLSPVSTSQARVSPVSATPSASRRRDYPIVTEAQPPGRTYVCSISMRSCAAASYVSSDRFSSTKPSLPPPRILTGYVVTGVFLEAIGVYAPIAEWGGAGASVPLTGFGSSLAKGVEKAVAEQGWLGILTGGLTPPPAGHRRGGDLRRHRCPGVPAGGEAVARPPCFRFLLRPDGRGFGRRLRRGFFAP